MNLIDELYSLRYELRNQIKITRSLLLKEQNEAAYNFVFKETVETVKRLSELFGKINYYDPDTGYAKGALAKLGQLEEYLEIIEDALGNEERQHNLDPWSIG